MDHMHTSCINQVGSRLFYACCALEGMTIFGADMSNAFAEAPPPKQQFYMRPDTQFHNWWTRSLGRDPIPPGYVLPVLHALQGHLKAPHL